MGAVFDYNGNQILPEDELSGLDDLLEDRLLVWHDEFSSPHIDTNKWGIVYGKTREVASYAENPERVTSVGQGLSYRCVKDNPHPADGIVYSCPYLSTKNLFEFMYGRIEAKLRFPSVTPHHSTFWTIGANYNIKSTSEEDVLNKSLGVLFPSCGEIDIAEFDNGTVGARTHWASNGFDTDSTSQTGGNVSTLTSSPTDWHIYSCEWTSSSITFYVDGVQKGAWDTSNGTVNGWNPFKAPHFLVLNCVPFLTGTPTWDIAQTDVAWVRVYAPENVSSLIPETSISIDATASITVGQRKWLAPTFSPENPTDMTLNWLSHNEGIVTCYGGMLIGVAAGTTYVQCATKHGYTALCKVTVS